MSLNLNDNNRGGTFCLSNAGLAIGSTASQIAIAAPNGAGVDYCIKGRSYHKADAATAAITAADTQAVLTTCLYVICLNAAGTVSSVKGREVLNADLAAGTASAQGGGAVASRGHRAGDRRAGHGPGHVPRPAQQP